ncbi:male sterility protein [Hortaea werneckii]|uniref:Polyketide synthase-like phosphopantetheine-binding domain-containing protein n=1 Tax=Hortaea werneckii TaxID=91943 RepID=A0A3M7G2Y5_HORWE|nr:male sterility protein [Hortaea werneckii]KAI7562816.1 male sterility protein [Hortaea werneckii]KAI7625279.1 male sterility protein [Hortaea werneckii]KAI7634507.1 male sterility protein [Hortaea werneckii]KAI7680488.1 male sterility protein [Hortaea werneckii]
MAPIATADLEKTSSRSSNDSVLPSATADKRLKALWYEHGHPYSERFANPSLISLPSLLEYNARTRGDEIGFLCPEENGFRKISWIEFNDLVRALAASYAGTFQAQLVAGTANAKQPTVALLGVGHTFQYFATQLALVRLGFRVLLLSPSNATAARDHLLDACDVVGIVAEEQFLQTVQDLDMPVTKLLSRPTKDAVSEQTHALAFVPTDFWNSHSFVIHSSGTTGLPKPIIHTHRSMMLIARMYRLFPEFYISNWYLAFPLFHIAGISIALSGLPNGLALTFPPLNWPPAPGSILSAWRELEAIDMPADCLHCAPAVIEDLYEYIKDTIAKDFSPLTQLKVLQPGGASLAPSLLEKLVELGCNVKTTYGSTEIGPPWRTMPHTRNNAHCYRVKNLFPENKFLEMQPIGNGMFEPVVYKGFPLAAELWPSESSPTPYRTNDLFVEVPPGSGLFTLQGRKDDLLVHSNGEKTNALPLQMALDGCPQIQKAAVFGTGKPCTAAIIQPSITANDQLSSNEDILAAVEACNQILPSHSRVHRSMVHILRDGLVLPVTPKGSVRRKDVESLYKKELEGLYRTLEDGGPGNALREDDKNLSNEDYVFQSVRKALQVDNIPPTASFYSFGLDSQKAVRLRSSLLKRFGRFPLMYIFEYSTLETLIRKLSRPQAESSADSLRSAHHLWIQSSIEKYTQEIESWPPLAGKREKSMDGEVIYLTGATGSLGNALLESFVANSNVSKVYCAIRGSKERLANALRGRGYASSVSDSPKIEVVPYEMSDSHLGLGYQRYSNLAKEVTLVLHNAWKMDFNTPVHEFEQDCLRSAIHLMHFANTGMSKIFAFSSSVATHLGPAAAGKEVAEAEMANDPNLALDTGYAQSKFVVEILAQSFARHTGLPVAVLRIGQLCGHSKLAAWNETEMFPIMINTGLNHLKAMPRLEGQMVDWLPVDICAASIDSLLTAAPQPKPLDSADTAGNSLRSRVHNLVNPKALPWDSFLDVLLDASGMDFDRIPMSEWVVRLQALSESGIEVPGTRLLSFFQDMASGDGDSGPVFSTQKTCRYAPVLANVGTIDVRLMKSYLEKWSAA